MRSIRRAKVVFIFSLVVSLALAGTAGFFIGKNYVISKQPTNTIAGADFNLFWQAYAELKKNYLGDIDPQKFVYGAISGAYDSLGDPYTTFFSPDLNSQFQQELSGQLEGVGLKLGELDGLPAVIAPIAGSPAQQAGIKTKDLILKVDDLATKDQPLDLVVSKIRGAAGTKVKLLVQLAGSSQTKEFELTRQQISVATVETKYINDTAVISVSEFGTDTNSEFEKAYQEAQQKNVKSVILDLRGNPGGLLDSAVQMAEYFLKKDQVILIEQDKTSKTEQKVETERGWQNIKLAVLVDQGSASASEIFAGAIKDNNRGKIIGEKTFGKGVVQQLIDLGSGASAKITVSKWLTPNGTDIDKNGLTPDIIAPTPDNQNFSTSDPVVDRALQELK